MSAIDGTPFEASIRALVREILVTEVLPAIRAEIGASGSLSQQVADAAARGASPSGQTTNRLSTGDDGAWSAKQAADFLGVSLSLVRKWERLGRLRALPRTSTRLTFDPAVVKSFRASGHSNVVQIKKSRR